MSCDMHVWLLVMQLYIPRDLWSGLEKIMAVKLLHAKMEGGVDKLLKVQQITLKLTYNRIEI